MAKSRILTGSRAVIYLGDGKDPIGFFTSATWSIMQEKVPAYILGRYNPAEITPTAQEPIRMTLTGYRLIEGGPYQVMSATMLKDLMDEEDFSIKVVDRRTGKEVFYALQCRVTGWSSGVASRSVSDVRVEVIGIRGGDEYVKDQQGEEDGGAINLTDGVDEE